MRAPLALVLAVLLGSLIGGGTAVGAGVLIKSSKQVAKGAITSSDIRDRQVRLSDLSLDLRRRLAQAGVAGPVGAPGQAGPAGPAGAPGAAADPAKVAALEARVAALEALLTGVTRTDKTLRLDGVNLQLTNGAGATATANGTGNLIVGYNEAPGAQTGSHNLLLGEGHSATSHGAVLTGLRNTATAPHALVGGQQNTVALPLSVALTGCGHRIQPELAPVTCTDPPSPAFALVGTGQGHRVTAAQGAVLAGQGNEVTGLGSAIVSGQNNDVTGVRSAVLAGAGNSIGATLAAIVAGQANTASSNSAVVVGGTSGSATGLASVLLGGSNKTVAGFATSNPPTS